MQRIVDDFVALEDGQSAFSARASPPHWLTAQSPAYHEGRSLRLQVRCVVLQKEKG